MGVTLQWWRYLQVDPYTTSWFAFMSALQDRFEPQLNLPVPEIDADEEDSEEDLEEDLEEESKDHVMVEGGEPTEEEHRHESWR